MDESDFGMNIDISGLPGPLLNMVILVVSFLGLRLFFHYRTGTSYGFVSRLYALLAGRSEYQDDTLAEFWRRNKELERFNAIFNFKAKSLEDAHKLIKWFDEYDLDHKKFARLKVWFDIEKLEIKKATRTQAVSFMFLGIALALASVPSLDLGIRNAALIKFKDESQWIWLDHDRAYNAPYKIRRLKNWHGGRGKYGRTITGFDEERNDIRTFYRSDIERYIEINTRSVRRGTTKKVPMFQRLCSYRFLKMNADASGTSVGYDGVAARIARVHQYGQRDQIGPGAFAKYPVRELLGFTAGDEQMITEQVVNSLGSAAR